VTNEQNIVANISVMVISGLTTQAQRPGPRDAAIATVMRWPGSLQRMVRRHSRCPNALMMNHTKKPPAVRRNNMSKM